MRRAGGLLKVVTMGGLSLPPGSSPCPNATLASVRRRSRIGKSNAEVISERQQLLLAPKAVLETPALGAVRSYEKVETIRQRACSPCRVSWRSVLQRLLNPWEYLLPRPASYPKCHSTWCHSATLAGTLGTALKRHDPRKKGTKKPPQNVLGGCGLWRIGCGDGI